MQRGLHRASPRPGLAGQDGQTMAGGQSQEQPLWSHRRQESLEVFLTLQLFLSDSSPGKMQMYSTPADFGGEKNPPPIPNENFLSCRNSYLGERRQAMLLKSADFPTVHPHLRDNRLVYYSLLNRKKRAALLRAIVFFLPGFQRKGPHLGLKLILD